ncbi:MAG: polyketide cyclase [Solirubrobacterales bacterium]|nr:polyketide cyclase [Solirubrobacterales bacterium]
MPTLQQTDETFLTNAPTRFSETFLIPKPAAAVWEELTSDKPLDWCRALSIRWTSPRPLGIGATRTAKILGALTANERFFIWEDGRRKAFCITDANLPVFSRLAEDFLVEPLGPDRSSFTWTIAMEPKGLGKAGAPANKLLVASLFKDTRRHFDAS